MLGVPVQCLLDLFVAGISLMIGLGMFILIASILCSAAFIHYAKVVFKVGKLMSDDMFRHFILNLLTSNKAERPYWDDEHEASKPSLSTCGK
ncbi:hypothetical protein RJ641_012353 [Dillenia turbinata]|uniref:Uncharacterized protein n=1 Tax=Dillenia turbinata TaxID=194707 RepID=A0AAN8V1C1_9MAGN